jgi:formylglycine-generating enzyme required for sulfatase activity
VAEGTDAGSAVYGQSWDQGPADFNNAGGLSPYGTMAQGGNMWEWTETAYAYGQELRGGPAVGNSESLESSCIHTGLEPTSENYFFGFRVASVPEPSALSLLAVGLGVVLRRRRRTV